MNPPRTCKAWDCVRILSVRILSFSHSRITTIVCVTALYCWSHVCVCASKIQQLVVNPSSTFHLTPPSTFHVSIHVTFHFFICIYLGGHNGVPVLVIFNVLMSNVFISGCICLQSNPWNKPRLLTSEWDTRFCIYSAPKQSEELKYYNHGYIQPILLCGNESSTISKLERNY